MNSTMEAMIDISEEITKEKCSLQIDEDLNHYHRAIRKYAQWELGI